MSFWIAAAQLSLRLPFAGSLKDRRHVVRSLTDGVRGRFAISASDLGPDGCHNAAELGFAAAGSSSAELDERMGNLEKYLYQREAVTRGFGLFSKALFCFSQGSVEGNGVIRDGERGGKKS